MATPAGTWVGRQRGGLQVSRSLVQHRHQRWLEPVNRSLAQRPSDAQRSGTPPTFTPVQICSLIAPACETQMREGVKLARWTYAHLAAKAIECQFVERTSPHSIGRFLREVNLKPHRVQGWINTPRDGDFAARCLRNLSARPGTRRRGY